MIDLITAVLGLGLVAFLAFGLFMLDACHSGSYCHNNDGEISDYDN